MTLRTEEISKRYGNKWILKDVSFTAERGMVTGVFGPSAAGKSTLLRVLAGEANNGGRIFGDDREVKSAAASVFGQNDSAGIFGRIFAGAPRGAKGESIAESFAGYLKAVDDILIIDDVFAALDRDLRRGLTSDLRKFVKEKNAVAVVAFSRFSDAMTCCDSIVVLDRGESLQNGSPQEIYLEPASARVAGIAGRNNLFEARRLTSTKIEIPEFQTINGEHRIFTGKTDKSRFAPINKNNILAIRPENIVISTGASFPEDNLLRATITGVRFRGATTVVELDANGLELEALVPRLVGIETGAECMLGLPPDRIQVFNS